MNILYFGRHPFFKDNIYGTNLVWERDKSVFPLEESIAKKFLRHTDSFKVVPGDDKPLQIAPKKMELSNDEHHLNLLNQMPNVEAVASYVFTNFGGYRLPDGLSLPAARDMAKMMFGQFLSDEGEYTPASKAVVAPDATGWEKGPVLPSSIGLEWGAAAPNKQIIELSATGMSNGDIGRQVGLHHKQVAKILKDQEGQTDGEKGTVGH